MAVIVSSSVNQNSSVVSGNIQRIIIVKTNPGYGSNPGHEGTGQVVAVLCGAPPPLTSWLRFPGRLVSTPGVQWLAGIHDPRFVLFKVAPLNLSSAVKKLAGPLAKSGGPSF
jgi:hypothetical protein